MSCWSFCSSWAMSRLLSLLSCWRSEEPDWAQAPAQNRPARVNPVRLRRRIFLASMFVSPCSFLRLQDCLHFEEPAAAGKVAPFVRAGVFEGSTFVLGEI